MELDALAEQELHCLVRLVAQLLGEHDPAERPEVVAPEPEHAAAVAVVLSPNSSGAPRTYRPSPRRRALKRRLDEKGS